MSDNVSKTAGMTLSGMQWGAQTAISVAFAGFLALTGLLSFPVPWTPVPFSLMPFGLLVTGAAQRPGFAVVSVAIYLAAAGLGAPIFAGGESGWHHFGEQTAGYLFGFLVVPPLVAVYLRSRRGMLPTRAAMPLAGLVGLGLAVGIGAIAWMWSTGSSLASLDSEVASSWGVARSALWFLMFVVTALTALIVWTLQRNRGQQQEALNLFLIMIGAIIAMHVLGVTVLWATTELSLMAAIILGSIVFLPFDLLKAGAAAMLTLPFVPRDSNA